MSTEQICIIKSSSSEATSEIAAEIASNLRGGEVIELLSDLGGGKTTFVKGLARGLGVQEEVHSPSFTIRSEHKGKTINLIHCDFYRLKEPGIMRQEITEDFSRKDAVIVIEWADIIEDLLPENKLAIRIKVISENVRELHIHYNDKNQYLITHQYLTS